MKTLEDLAKEESVYRPGETVRKSLSQMTLVCLVGGVGVGKNYLMKASGLSVAGRVTSRKPRPDDNPKIYKYFTNRQLADMIDRKELVQYAVDLPNQVIYGTVPDDYVTKDVTVADIWHWSVNDLADKGFKSVKAVSIITPWEQWKDQLKERFDGRDDTYRLARLKEAVESLAWTQQQILAKNKNHAVIINDNERTNVSIKLLHDFCNNKTIATPNKTIDLIDSLTQNLSRLI